jgi:hypothetical protein
MLALLLVAVIPGGVSAQRRTLTREEAYSTLMLICVRSGIWPAAVDPATNKRLTIGILGRTDIAADLRKVGRSAERLWLPAGAITYVEGRTPEDLAACHVVFIGEVPDETRIRTISFFKDRPVLLFSEAASFLTEGGGVRVAIVDELLQFELNLDALKSAGIELSANLRSQSRGVLLDGTYRANTNRQEQPRPTAGD